VDPDEQAIEDLPILSSAEDEEAAESSDVERRVSLILITNAVYA
jgi:hypothetical protein